MGQESIAVDMAHMDKLLPRSTPDRVELGEIMRFHVTHHTRYRYSRPIFLEPLTVRLRPRVDFRQRLLEFSLELDPAPAQLCEALDLEGNHVAYASFGDLTESLTLTTSFVAERSEERRVGKDCV